MSSRSPEELQVQVQQLRDWLNTQPNLPKDNVDDKLLRRFVHSCYYDVEKAKKAAELFFTIRGSSPELLTNRDPLSPQIQKYLKIVNLAQCKISDGKNLWVWQLNDPGLDNYDYLQDARIFFLSTDAWLLEDEFLEEADYVILDVKDLSLKFLTKFNVSIARKLSKYQEGAMPIRLKQVHLINAPPFIDKIFGLLKPFLNKDMTEMIHFHSPKSNKLSEYFSKEDLPSDYGGSMESMESFMQKSLALLSRQRESLMNDNLWRSIETKKTKNKTEISAPVQSPITSFRSLAID